MNTFTRRSAIVRLSGAAAALAVSTNIQKGLKAADAAADAALIARELPGLPVRVQWTREQEHAWEPFGPAMVTRLKASLDDSGAISDWNFEVWSNTHSMRPGGAGSMLAAQHMAQPFIVPAPTALPTSSRPMSRWPSRAGAAGAWCGG